MPSLYPVPETVNLHVIASCDQRCIYCFGRFPALGRIDPGVDWKAILDLLACAGVKRVNFSGGEPTLHPDIAAMLGQARSVGFITSIVTNGARLTDELLQLCDIVALSIDSADDASNARLGRSGSPSYVQRDILSNFVSGLLLLALRPFRVGDQIIVGETEGTVERVVLRATQLRTYDGRVVLVPNAELFTARVTNNTAAPIRRGKFSVHLGYGADVPAAIGAFRDAVATAPGVLSEPAPSVHILELGPEDVVLEVRFWTDSRRSDHVETAAQARRAVLSAAKEGGFPLPDPDARVVTLRGRLPEP